MTTGKSDWGNSSAHVTLGYVELTIIKLASPHLQNLGKTSTLSHEYHCQNLLASALLSWGSQLPLGGLGIS